jgi:membrane protein implicated in regulation of membrane protease activity
MPVWVWWVGIAVIFAVYEMFTFTFLTIWFAIGAGVAALLAYFNFHPGLQWTAFAAVTIFLVAITRRFSQKLTGNFQTKGVGSDRFIGLKGTVTENIDPVSRTGKAEVVHETWLALSGSGEKISTGATIEVVGIDGTRLIVKEVK